MQATALYYWTHGTARCRIAGDVESGYILTPVTPEQAARLDRAMAEDGVADLPTGDLPTLDLRERRDGSELAPRMRVLRVALPKPVGLPGVDLADCDDARTVFTWS